MTTLITAAKETREKEAPPESRHTSEVTAAQASGLINLLSNRFIRVRVPAI